VYLFCASKALYLVGLDAKKRTPAQLATAQQRAAELQKKIMASRGDNP
jgi:hypothetical protein